MSSISNAAAIDRSVKDRMHLYDNPQVHTSTALRCRWREKSNAYHWLIDRWLFHHKYISNRHLSSRSLRPLYPGAVRKGSFREGLVRSPLFNHSYVEFPIPTSLNQSIAHPTWSCTPMEAIRRYAAYHPLLNPSSHSSHLALQRSSSIKKVSQFP